ncbi:MAG TPA: YMGG-like glycine zipper-containing protein [Flavipsychrobacter sp.]|nr:YMGG-like glycine zipper-containing protein [Flavipsychrobacter sp.]
MKRILIILATAGFLSSCDNAARREQEAAMKAQQYTMDSLRQELARQSVIDSMAAVALAEEEARMEEQKAVQRSATRSSSGRSYSSASRSGSYAAERNDPPAPTVVYRDVPAELQKKRWSSKATGALIGAGAGALGGALIGKKKGTGAIIGGASGAAVGLGAGAIIDANRKKKEEQRRLEQQQQNR